MCDTDRGTGRSSKQMKEAPDNAYFITSDSLWYAKDLAHEVGRTDLKILPVSWIKGESWYGLRLPPVILDHAINLSEKENRLFNRILSLVRSWR